ncbi:MAG TPA: hypothetical protein VGE02_11445 [Gemmatimonadales bacterium]
MPRTTLQKLARLALGAAAIPLVTACWSDVNEAQDVGDTVTAFDSTGTTAQPLPPPPPTDAAAPPMDSAARADSLGDTLGDTLGVPTSSGTAGGGATTPPTNPPPM